MVWTKEEGVGPFGRLQGFKNHSDVEKRVAGDRFERNVVDDVSDAFYAFVCRFYFLNNCCGFCLNKRDSAPLNDSP